MQLKGLLSRYGKLVDGEFWLDKIKSQCFVTVENRSIYLFLLMVYLVSYIG
jgi:hypothetical protein